MWFEREFGNGTTVGAETVKRCKGLKLLVAALALGICGTVANADTQIELPAQASVDEGYIRISEVAKLSGDQAKRISKVYIGPAPAEGKERQVTREQILRRLRGLGIVEEVKFTGSESVVVKVGKKEEIAATAAAIKASFAPQQKFAVAAPAHRPVAVATRSSILYPSQQTAVLPVEKPATRRPVARAEVASQAVPAKFSPVLDEDACKRRINHLVSEYIKKQLDNKSTDVVCEIRRMDIPQKGAVTLDFNGISRGRLPGYAGISLTLRDANGKVCGHGTADVSSQANIAVPVTARPLRRGQDVGSGDVVLRMMRYSKDLPVKATNPKKFIGMIPVRTLRAGMPVSIADFEPGLDIKRGQAVTVKVKGPGFSIREMCTALGDGRKGDMVKVESLIGKNTYEVRVVGPGMADLPVNGADKKKQDDKDRGDR